jgi:hypothetical protein
VIPLDVDDRSEIRAALRARLDNEALPYLQRRLRTFGEREYQRRPEAEREHLRRADVGIFNDAVDRVQRLRRLIEVMA